ncbi:MAG: hypothetical protein ACI920_003824, partial [Saprospiraceae bacterium]
NLNLRFFSSQIIDFKSQNPKTAINHYKTTSYSVYFFADASLMKNRLKTT